MSLKILAIETSCDETSAAVLEGNDVMSNIVSSQEFHSDYGGIVPELASRSQIQVIDKVAEKAFAVSGFDPNDINLVGATRGPGLIGSLLTGLNYAKAFAVTRGIKFIGINHIESHLYSCFIGQKEIEFPFVSLVVSGGHTILSCVKGYFDYRILGQTQDDAAGEAFDKGAKMLGLPYPGGPEIDKLAKDGREDFHKFPVAQLKENKYDFSFSGVKTSLLYYLKKLTQAKDLRLQNIPLNDICASYQKAIVTSLVEKTIAAADEYGVRNIAVSGGVSANSRLRDDFHKTESEGFRIFFPALEYTTDNAAMVGYTAYLKFNFTNPGEDYFRKSIIEPAFAKFLAY
jgi:N6-L-threonylcarbamoyladenine synthase